ncbi:ATP-dependent DNA helicase RecG [Oecophyllibacter saccharovorans]|uniref:ATP-dependent DNA helicase RecG n=1 Tax=Oecophyllibacter saccharovorans TaxID=2558360 RepID=UPI00114440F3|nr:ATP-dependent DNA helicase RecG [Oecophyllibacter saccharovorans]QDH15756.1 ATP-dependent DNA helicase RecG [Oecophyllibacter saccharovorans]
MPLSPPPDILAPLLAPLDSLPGIGPHHAGLLEKICGGRRVIDLLFTLPERIEDRRQLLSLDQARLLPAGTLLTARARVEAIRAPSRPGLPTVVTLSEETSLTTLELVFFQKGRLSLPSIGSDLIVSGKTSFYQDRLTINGPDHLLPWEKRHLFPKLEPVWPLTAGLFNGTVRRAMQAALAKLPDLPEWHVPSLVAQRNWPRFTQALRGLQDPSAHQEMEDPFEFFARARARLAADELLADQLCLSLARRQAHERPGRSLPGTGELQTEMLNRFGHTPTAAQQQAFSEISADMRAPAPMTRLLQGDVGSGKTLVAMMAMLQAVESGAQAALMSPTELLAQQHFETLSQFCPVPPVFLSGRIKGRARQEALEQIASGTARLVVGTHALFQDKVQFADLGLAIVDEQHRFGVEQRMRLGAKGTATDLLVMTATPIPRTVQLAEWGEMGVSRIEGKPAGRLPVQTSVHDMAQMDSLLEGVQRALDSGQQIFWVCPMIENSESQSAAAAEERWAELTRRFGPLTGLAHGRQDPGERQQALEDFRTGKTRLLVATTVIEVGVDIPDATIMIIEEAERFGLAQLHQLRGRVGRGREKSYCLLLHHSDASPTARARLALLRETEDGFRIADEDFRLRGGGDLAGNRQSGLPGFRLATVENGLSHLLSTMEQEARLLLHQTPLLSPGPGTASGAPDSKAASLHQLLHLFDRARPERLLISG